MTGLWGCAEMGEYLPAVALGGSAVAVSAGYYHTCVLLVRCGGEGSGGMMMRWWKDRGRKSVILTQLIAAAAL